MDYRIVIQVKAKLHEILEVYKLTFGSDEYQEEDICYELYSPYLAVATRYWPFRQPEVIFTFGRFFTEMEEFKEFLKKVLSFINELAKRGKLIKAEIMYNDEKVGVMILPIGTPTPVGWKVTDVLDYVIICRMENTDQSDINWI